MTILISADWHLSENPRDEYRFAFLDRLRKTIKSQDVICLVLLGDLTEAKDRHSAVLVNRIVDHMWQLSKLCPIVIVRGNHDGLIGENPFFHFLERVGEARAISWVLHPQDAKNLPGAPLAEMGNVLLLPHTPNHERDWANVSWPRSQGSWILTHNTFRGARSDNGQPLPGIPLKALPSNPQVISGDVHVPQELGNVTYVGAPFTVDFGDSFKPRYFLIDKGMLRSIASNGPMKRLLEVSSINELSVKGLEFGDVLKVRVHITSDQYASWPKMQDEVRKWGEDRKMHVHIVQPVVEQVRSKVKARVQQSRRTDQQVLETYAKQRGVDDRTLQTGVRLMGKANA